MDLDELTRKAWEAAPEDAGDFRIVLLCSHNACTHTGHDVMVSFDVDEGTLTLRAEDA